MASPSGARAGLFDLPLELRQKIYRDCLPRSKDNDDYIATLNEDPEPLQSLRAADPRIASEVQDEERMTLQRLTFNVTTCDWKPPAVPIAYPNLEEVSIVFDLYPFLETPPKRESVEDEGTELVCTESRDGEYLATLRSNLSRFIEWFKQANDRKLEYLQVEFKDLKDCDKRLCDIQFDRRGCLAGHTLRIRPGDNVKEDFTILEYLLMPLEDFPLVNQPFMPDFDGIHDYTDLIEAGIKSVYDGFYQHIINNTWENWLKGKRVVPLRQQFMREMRGHSRCVEEKWLMHLEDMEDDGYDSDDSLRSWK